MISTPNFKKSGSIWKLTATRRKKIIERVCCQLRKDYGRPRLGNPKDTLDDFIYIILSNKTSPLIAKRIYEKLKFTFPKWNLALNANTIEIRTIIKPAGLSKIKSSCIRRALRTIRDDFGSCTLTALNKLPINKAEEYLSSLPGASIKVAKCVCMYTLGAHVLPVDTHVHRITSRLSWTSRKRADQCHAELEALVPPKLRYAFHVDCIIHGRRICRSRYPKCEKCHIARDCLFFKRKFDGGKQRKTGRSGFIQWGGRIVPRI